MARALSKFNLTLFLLATLTLGCARLTNNPRFGTATGIVNGEAVDIGDPIAKSTVNLYYIFPNSKRVRSLCTGTLIGTRTILTAAHCFVDTAAKNELSFTELVSQLHVGFGFEVLTEVDQPEANLVKAESVTVHPEYVMDRFLDASNGLALYDLAIVQLSTDAPADALTVPLLENASVLATGTQLVLAGFGVMEEDGVRVRAKALNKITVAIENPTVNPIQFSFLVVDGRAACNGDSGGPAYYSDPSGTTYLAGVTSWSDSFCSRIGGYTSVPALLAWIKSAM